VELALAAWPQQQQPCLPVLDLVAISLVWLGHSYTNKEDQLQT